MRTYTRLPQLHTYIQTILYIHGSSGKSEMYGIFVFGSHADDAGEASTEVDVQPAPGINDLLPSRLGEWDLSHSLLKHHETRTKPETVRGRAPTMD